LGIIDFHLLCFKRAFAIWYLEAAVWTLGISSSQLSYFFYFFLWLIQALTFEWSITSSTANTQNIQTNCPCDRIARDGFSA
jgi:hypothetical protein